jgi:hypothetical protein
MNLGTIGAFDQPNRYGLSKSLRMFNIHHKCGQRDYQILNYLAEQLLISIEDVGWPAAIPGSPELAEVRSPLLRKRVERFAALRRIQPL